MVEKINLTQIAALLNATPNTLRSELTPLDAAVMPWRPAPDRWCISEIIGHLVDTDTLAFADRIRAMLAEDKHAIKSWDINQRAIDRGDADRNIFELIDELAALREDHTQLVLSLTPDQLRQYGTHPTAGPLQVVDFVQEWPFHDRAHLSQILGNVQLYLWSNMGTMKQLLDPPA